jgi:Zn-finger nucleic acid-binding protein
VVAAERKKRVEKVAVEKVAVAKGKVATEGVVATKVGMEARVDVDTSPRCTGVVAAERKEGVEKVAVEKGKVAVEKVAVEKVAVEKVAVEKVAVATEGVEKVAVAMVGMEAKVDVDTSPRCTGVVAEWRVAATKVGVTVRGCGTRARDPRCLLLSRRC